MVLFKDRKRFVWTLLSMGLAAVWFGGRGIESVVPEPAVPVQTELERIELKSRANIEVSSKDRRDAEAVGGEIHPSASMSSEVREETPTTEFRHWLEHYLAANAPAETAALIARGEVLAARRREFLFELIKNDPEAALAAAVPGPSRSRLPETIQALLEEPVSGRGFFGVLIADNFDHGQHEVRREVFLNRQTYDAFVYGSRLEKTTCDNAVLWGIAVGDPKDKSVRKRLAVHRDPIRRLAHDDHASSSKTDEACPISGRPSGWRGTPALAEVAGQIEPFCGVGHVELLNRRLASAEAGQELLFTAADSWAQGPKTCLFMRAAFPDDPAEPISEDGAYVLMDGVNQWFVENSYGTTSILPTVTPLLMLPHPKAWYGIQGSGTLMNDAREAARAAGFDTDGFQFDIVRHAAVPGFGWNGLGYVRSKGTWLQSSSLGVACHELGHNYGLWHANFWNATGDSVIGPGSNVEYGNSFDTMGAATAGNNQFNVVAKHQLDWLPEFFVQNASQSGVYRLHSFDVSRLHLGRKYALRVRKDYDRNYWAEFREKFAGNRWFRNGVLLNWDPWNNGVVNSASGTHLLDTTPGTPAGNSSKDDAALVVGRTLSDLAAGVHLTPVARSDSTTENWIDVVVNLGEFTTNLAPFILLAADRTSVSTGAVVNFSASAFDADGDVLAYGWDFGDGTFGLNVPTVNKSWNTDGEFVVRCTVSDMKGGLFSQHIVVTVGSPGTFRASGRIETPFGAPVEGVRVHNGQGGSDYRGAYSDSDGYFVLPNLGVGQLTLSAAKYGYALTRAGWTNPITVGSENTADLNWTAVAVPVVRIAAMDATASESGSNPGRFLISRSGSINDPLTVRLTSHGTAFLNTDYSITPAPSGSPLQVVIPAGASVVSLGVTPQADSLSEGPETVTLTLMEHSAYVLGSLAEATVTIADDDPLLKPFVSVSAGGTFGDNLATEAGDDAGVFTFSRSGGSVAGELVIQYSLAGSATPGSDYTALAGVVIIPAGETATALSLSAMDDIEVETNETVEVTILADAAYSISAGSATITIVDDDPITVTVTATDLSAREAGSGTAGFTFTRQGSLLANLVVNYALSGTASNTVDYSTLSGTVTIPAGKATANISLNPVSDALVEGQESVTVTLVSSPVYNIGNPGSASIRILDDQTPGVSLAASDSAASESGANDGAFTFTRTGSTATPLLVRFAIHGSARNGIDYVSIGESIEIPAGSATASLAVTPLDDSFLESPEKVTLVIVSDPGYNIETTSPQSVTISDDDTGLPAVGFTLSSSAGLESDSFAQLSVSLSSNANTIVTVNYAVTGGTASGGGTDYSLVNGTLRFLPGTNFQSLGIFINNDTLVESNETIVVTLSNPAGSVLDASASHTYTILDDDGSGAISIVAVEGVIDENGVASGRFRISRSIATAAPQTVYFQATGTASCPSDYQRLPEVVVIPAGSNSVDLLIVPVDDSTEETDETVIVDLLSAPGGRIGSPSSASVTIVDNAAAASLPIVTIEAVDSTASEPGADTATFIVRRAGPTNEALVVHYTVGGTATSGADFFSIGTLVVIPAGVEEQGMAITPRDDSVFESNETVVITLTLSGAYRVGLTASATAVIADNEIGVSVVSIGDTQEDGSALGRFVITRSGSVASNLLVQFAVGGTAGANDFQELGSTVLLPAGSNSVSLSVVPVDDALPEGEESVVLILAPGAGYSVTSLQNATVLLLDNEPALSVTASDSSAYEGGGQGVFKVMRSGSTNSSLTVRFLVSGAASNGVDYALLSGTAVIEAGRKSVDILVIPINDAVLEGEENVRLTLVEDATYSLFVPVSATVTMLDDELNSMPIIAIRNPATNSIYLPDTNAWLVLDAMVTDDGRPDPPAAVTTVWGNVSGPAPVLFADASSPGTMGRFSANGTYVIRVSADDGQLSATDEITVVVGGGSMGNTAPTVRAGSPQTILLADEVSLHGVIADDALPASPGAVTSLWVKASGPGTVTFADAELTETTATFSAGGIYVLRLLAGDGEVMVADEVAITVIAPTVVTLQILNSTVQEFSGQQAFPKVEAVELSRTGDLSADLAVHLNIQGSALNGVDYRSLPEVVLIPAGFSSASLGIVPVRDGVPEGDEYVEVSLMPDASYQMGAMTTGTVTIQDAPWDMWRLEMFSAEQNGNPAISGELADPDHDDLPNLLEYGLNTHPWLPDAAPGFSGGMESINGVAGGQRGFVVRFNQRLVPGDLSYEVQVSSGFNEWLSGRNISRELFPRLENEDGTTFTTRVQILGISASSPPAMVRLKVQLSSEAGTPGGTN